jgi:glucose/arabinose dehydrogenase
MIVLLPLAWQRDVQMHIWINAVADSGTTDGAGRRCFAGVTVDWKARKVQVQRMTNFRIRTLTLMKALFAALVVIAAARASLADSVRSGDAAFSDWHGDAPGAIRKITPEALPAPFASRSSSAAGMLIPRPVGASPRLPPGFTAMVFAVDLDRPRTMRTAPNGDIFVAESGGQIRVLHTADGAEKPIASATFAHGLRMPFGVAFWPPGPSSRFVYVGETNRIVRFPYQPGDLHAREPAEVVVPSLPEGGHWTRDIAFAPDGSRMFVSVGSEGNLDRDLTGQPPADLPLGAAWGDDLDRADVLEFAPDGGGKRIYASGLRNCFAEAIHPASGDLWCVVNERDGLGDNLPPDYATHVQSGAFYGWPWFYIGDHPEPRMNGARADLAGKVTVPDVLIQPHSAPLGIVFYDGTQFPAAYRGDAFVALHGSWNRATRTGYKVVRLRFQNGRPTGEYEDFLTGFIASDQSVWARPVGLTVMHDGSLLVSEDGNGTIWRAAYRNGP